MPSKPDNLRLTTREFKTPGQRATARDLLLMWPRHKNFAEISRRTGWSEPQLRTVYNEYFEAADSPSDASSPLDADVVDSWEEAGLSDQDAYRAGYRDGYGDGYADASEES